MLLLFSNQLLSQFDFSTSGSSIFRSIIFISIIAIIYNSNNRELITNRQRFLTLSSLVEALKQKVTGSKMSITSDDSLFANRDCKLRQLSSFNK